MEIKTVVVGPLGTNCYVLIQNGQCLIVDPGEESQKIKDAVGKNQVVGIIVTHYHFDHIGALEEVKDFYQVPIFDKNNLKEGNHTISSFSFVVIHTPGHKEDSISLLFSNHMFVGDFIFQNSIGRTDLEGGDFSEMKNSIEKIKTYSDDIIIYPGHGPKTTLGEEKRNNMFFG